MNRFVIAFLLVMLSLFVRPAFANEEAHKEEKHEGGGGDAHGGGDGHGGGDAHGGGGEQKAGKELMDLEKQVATSAAKITAKEHSVHELIKQKQAEKDPHKLAEIIKLLQKEHKDLNELIKEHATQMGVLQYRYPERGVSLQRKYKRFNSKSLEEMEKSIGLEGHLARSREKVRKVYGVEDSKKTKPNGVHGPAHKDNESILNPSTISK